MLGTEVRKPAVAGQFYPADPARLRRDLTGMIADSTPKHDPCLGVVVPHAGIVYSGACAGTVWGSIPIPPIVVILAPNHTGLFGAPGGASIWSQGAFETPLGQVPIAEEFSSALTARCALVAHDPLAHMREHAIEVQLPFLQLLGAGVEVVPIVVAWDRWDRARELGDAIAGVVGEQEESVLIAASSDMTHYESADSAARKDEFALAEIERLDGERLLQVCHDRNVTMCGRAPTAVMLAAARALGATTAELIDYRHSGWVTGDDSSVVAYAAVTVR